MRKIIVFNLITLDGFFAGPSGELDWHNVDDEFQKWMHKRIQATPFGTLIFGRTTYELMANFWPTPRARGQDPITANYMNTTPKIVYSKTMEKITDRPHWKNITVLYEIKPEEIHKLKSQQGRDIGIFGSGTIIQQFTNLGLIDEYQLLLNPIVLGAGKPMFKDFKKMGLKVLEMRSFKNGNVLLRYEPK